jgi:hypothetical protein
MLYTSLLNIYIYIYIYILFFTYFPEGNLKKKTGAVKGRKQQN